MEKGSKEIKVKNKTFYQLLSLKKDLGFEDMGELVNMLIRYYRVHYPEEEVRS